jgi:hypothetical protein
MNPVIFAQKSQFFEHWVGINPVILTQKIKSFETLGWYQPSDFNPKKLIKKNTGLVSTQ